ncbi:DUF6881 domain-containing protein [Microbacterium immunditiarum]|uniref:DUF6881 domain-containing protein n=1 Tax=Microbacterium immunditiarum TaxID=337480 RepID=UPI003CCD113E
MSLAASEVGSELVYVYLRVRWHHEFPDEPILLLSEIVGSDEVRKVEIYADGRYDFANGSCSTGTTLLSELPMTSVDESMDRGDPEPPLRTGAREARATCGHRRSSRVPGGAGRA